MTIAELVDRATRLRSESKEFTYQELSGDELELQELAELWVTSQEWATAARAVEKAVGAELVRVLGDSHESVTASGFLVWLGVGKKEKCVDSEGFFRWLFEFPEYAEKLFNPDTARKGSMPIAVRETFYEKTLVGEPRMQAVPVELLKGSKS